MEVKGQGACRGVLVAIVATAALAAAAGCGTKEQVELGSAFVKSGLIAASTGGTLEITAADHPQLAGTKITVPPNALARDTVITIGYDPANIMDGKADAIGPTVELGPEGTTFATPAELTIPFTGTFQAPRLVVYAKDASGTKVIPAHELTLDATNKTVRFQVPHFTEFQCGNEHEPPACDATTDCGPALGLPNWVCADGSVGGPTGRCLRGADGVCSWEVSWCPMTCSDAECGPAPALELLCPDGSTAAVLCNRHADGSCGWDISCAGSCEGSTGGPMDPTMPPPPHCTQTCAQDSDCPMGTICDATTAACIPSGASCGNTTCPDGTVCCNESCGICAAPGEACPQIACVHCGSDPSAPACPPGTTCDPMTGGCVPDGSACGPSQCGAGEYCCNASCGLCAPLGGACPQLGCAQCGDPNMGGTTCAPGETCDASGQCVSVCSPDACGPAPGLANWTCEDGTVGGPTGRCIPMNGSMGGPSTGGGDRPAPPPPGEPVCGWEIIWCPRACDPMECGPQPGLANYTCPDGMTIAGPTGQCLRNADGTCGWEIVQCP